MKNNIKMLFLFISVGIILFGFLGYKVYVDFFNNKTEDILDSISLYGYSLKSRDSQLYKSIYEELSDCLNEKEIDYENYASLISKLFIIDLYTLNNKISSTDIGGIEFIHPDLVSNFEENIGLNLYSNILVNLDGTREQILPEVSGVVVEGITTTTYEYNGVKYNGYLINTNISYVKDLDYPSNVDLTIIKDDNKLYIVKGESK